MGLAVCYTVEFMDGKDKRCSICKETKQTSEFHRNRSNKDGPARACKPCARAAVDAWRHKYPERHKASLRNYAKRNIERTRINRKIKLDHIRRLKEKPCADCGVQYPPRVMHFDHVRGEKTRDISAMARSNMSIKRIEEEIQKCEVRCANCHSIRHSQSDPD